MNIRPRPASVLQRLGEGIFIRTRLVYTAYPLYAGPRAPATCALCCDCVLSLAVARARGRATQWRASLDLGSWDLAFDIRVKSATYQSSHATNINR